MRRLRGILRTALVWGIAWTLPGIVWVRGLLWLTHAQVPGLGGVFWSSVIQNWTLVGAISGALFALVFSAAERRTHSLESLSMRRFAMWGAIGGAGLPLILFPAMARMIPSAIGQALGAAAVYGLLGAASAAGSLRLARRANPALPSTLTDHDALTASS